MDPAVSLVQAYLRANGYFTATEFPVLQRLASEAYQSLTDLDVLAVRFPRPQYYISGSERTRFELSVPMDDAALDHREQQIEILIGEVKEGRAALNRSATEPEVLRTALLRFGIIEAHEIEQVIEDLAHRGESRPESGCRVRLFAFGTYTGPRTDRYTVVTLRSVFEFFERRAERFAGALGAAQFKDPAVGMLMVAAKSGVFRTGAARKGT